MSYWRSSLGALRSLLLMVVLIDAAHAVDEHEIIVYGDTSAAVVAAVQAARMGRSVLLIAPRRHLGGMSVSGLGWTDSGDKSTIGGIAREFYRRLKRHYDDPAVWTRESAEDYSRYRSEADAMWTFEPHVAEATFAALLDEHAVKVVKERRLHRTAGVILRERRIVALRLVSGEEVRGAVFIDATYEGDLMAAAGVSYVVGREPNDRHGETLNGVQKARNVHHHHFRKSVDPYVVPGAPESGLLPGVHGADPGDDGSGDRRVQAYCFRVTLTDVAENRAPIPRPTDYDERLHELLLRNFEAGDLRFPLTLDLMPNRKTDSNNKGAVSTDFIGASDAYPEASDAERRRIVRAHESYQKGLLWTLANHPRVPEEVRRIMARWGLPKDEFVDNGHWPYQLYVREARRMVGESVMTEADCRRQRVAPDPVGVGSYNMDSHNCQRYVTPEGTVQNEGDVQEAPGGAYAIGYGSLVPQRDEVTNLLVPVCLSASHIAYGSIRMEPVFMVLGQSAATAAALAVERGVAVQEVDYGELRRRLLEDHQVLEPPAR